MHLSIEQGLQQSGRFAGRRLDPDEYDLAINAETILLLDKVFQDRKTQLATVYEEDQYSAEITNVYKREVSPTVVDKGNYVEVALPERKHLIINHIVGYYTGSERVDTLEPKSSYRCLKRTRYDDSWYKVGDVFTTGDLVLFFYGSVEKVNIEYYPTRLIGSEKINTTLQSYYNRTKKNNPVSELLARSIRVYQKGFKIDYVTIEYSTLPIKVNYRDNISSDLPENVQEWLVNQVITRILNQNNGEQSQVQIQNLKTETIQ